MALEPSVTMKAIIQQSTAAPADLAVTVKQVQDAIKAAVNPLFTSVTVEVYKK